MSRRTRGWVYKATRYDGRPRRLMWRGCAVISHRVVGLAYGGQGTRVWSTPFALIESEACRGGRAELDASPWPGSAEVGGDAKNRLEVLCRCPP